MNRIQIATSATFISVVQSGQVIFDKFTVFLKSMCKLSLAVISEAFLSFILYHVKQNVQSRKDALDSI